MYIVVCVITVCCLNVLLYRCLHFIIIVQYAYFFPLLILSFRKKCINCSCPREAHKLDRDPRTIVPYLESLGLENGISHEQKQLLRYVWHPSGISVELVGSERGPCLVHIWPTYINHY